MPDEEHPDYHMPLDKLTGKHGYALARDENSDEPPDPGAPVAYVADPMHDRPSNLTIEGMIYGIGQAAQSAAKEPESSAAWLMRLLAIAFLFPTVFLLARAVGLIH